jgi:pSer/pThr/pTyr-binding forkhead associated (FHA) protein
MELPVDNGGVAANPPADARSASDWKARFEAERSGRPFLLYADASGRQQIFFLEPAQASVSVGRRPPSDLLLDRDERVSRHHARFERVQGAWELVDDGSSNGTFVNERRLNGRCGLSDGDTVRFGATTTTFRSPEAGHQPATDPNEPPLAVSLSSTQRRVLAALCRPYRGRSGFASPAGDEQIAEELFLSVGEVRAHLRVLTAKLGVEEVTPAETRVRLVERAFSAGLISEREL